MMTMMMNMMILMLMNGMKKCRELLEIWHHKICCRIHKPLKL